jgi:hypothetical protein
MIARSASSRTLASSGVISEDCSGWA